MASCRIALALILAATAANAGDSLLIVPHPPKKLPPLIFHDELNMQHRIDASQEKLVVVHFWATWCVPCVKELPQVDQAMGKYRGKGLKVVAISLDGNNMGKVKKFFKENHITYLTPMLDTDMMSFQMSLSPGLPTTIFVNRKGQEFARVEGPLDWNSAETTKFIESHLK